jgi:hypothetical protein
MFDVSFSHFVQNGEVITSLTTNDQGTAEWDQVPAGSVGLTEQLPPGYGFMIAHCSYVPFDSQNTQAGLDSPDVNGWTQHLLLDPGSRVRNALLPFQLPG